MGHGGDGVKSTGTKSCEEVLSTSMKEAAKGGLTQFTKMNSKILEVVSQNNVRLLEKVRDMEEGCQKQFKEKDDQMKKLTSSIEAD